MYVVFLLWAFWGYTSYNTINTSSLFSLRGLDGSIEPMKYSISELIQGWKFFFSSNNDRNMYFINFNFNYQGQLDSITPNQSTFSRYLKAGYSKVSKKKKLLYPFVHWFNREVFHSSWAFSWVSWNNPLLSPSSHLDIVHRLTYLWSLKVSSYLLRVISPVLCVPCNPVWLNVHICFTSFHVPSLSNSVFLTVSCCDFSKKTKP